jgi:glycosyltransferase involved in cell wall biosynthesis
MASEPRVSDGFRLCVVHLDRDEPSETFARAHAELLPCRVSVIHRAADRRLYLDDEPLAAGSPGVGALRLGRRALLRAVDGDLAALRFSPEYRTGLRLCGATAVLAEFGPAGVEVMEACRALHVPLVVHFHGHDASRRSVLERHARSYRRLFELASAIVVPAEALRHRLVELGAPADRMHCSPNGVDCRRFRGARPAHAPPVFLAVGRLVEKKGTELTIAAFARMRRDLPRARLRIVGDGPLRGACERAAQDLCPGAVDFLGEQPHDLVARELQGARAFVQHSIAAADGDMEGMPVAVLEASSSALPVVATRHSGIPEVVVDELTGLLVDERDVDGTAAAMARLAADGALAAEFGRLGRIRVEARFSLDASIERLWRIMRRPRRRRCRHERGGARPRRRTGAEGRDRRARVLRRAPRAHGRVRVGCASRSACARERTRSRDPAGLRQRRAPGGADTSLAGAAARRGPLERLHARAENAARPVEAEASRARPRRPARDRAPHPIRARVREPAGGSADRLVRDPRPASDLSTIATLEIPGDPAQPQGIVPIEPRSLRPLCTASLVEGRPLAFASPAPAHLRPKAADTYDLPALHLEFLANPLDPVDAAPESRRPSVVFLGRLDPVKRPWLFVEVARLFPHVDFLMLGQAHFSGAGAGTRWMDGAPPNLRLLSHVDGAEKASVLSSAWALVNTSIHEGLPVSFLEALHCGLPIVSCQDPEEVATRFGVYVGRFDGSGTDAVPAFADALARLLDDAALRTELGAAGRAWVRASHTRERFVERFLQLVEELGA